MKRRMKHLPRVVQEYFTAVIYCTKDYSGDEIIPIPRSLNIEQGGTFLLNGKWISFTATQKFRTRCNCPGFVWDAVMKIDCFPHVSIPIFVFDAYVDGIGVMKAQLPGGIPIVRQRSSRELDDGELLRWVTEAVLFPLALLPSVEANVEHAASKDETLRWLPSSDGDENCAILELKYHGNVARVTFHFDPDTHLISSVTTMRPRAAGNKFEMTIWEGFYSHYENHGGLIVPTVMEAGWRLGSDARLEIYFKITNRNLVYFT
jgi:hypothetical protein